MVNARKSISNVQHKIDGFKAQLKMLSVLGNSLAKAEEEVKEEKTETAE